MDLSKAFDCIVHSILVAKFRHYELDEISVNLLKSYLSNRYQYVELRLKNNDSTESNNFTVKNRKIYMKTVI